MCDCSKLDWEGESHQNAGWAWNKQVRQPSVVLPAGGSVFMLRLGERNGTGQLPCSQSGVSGMCFEKSA